MKLPSDFQLSQASLQDFADCRRRFLLRHVWRLSWPAVESEPVLEHERYLQQGAAFHHRAQQFFIGIPAERLAASLHDPPMAAWWDHFMQVASEVEGFRQSSGWRLYPEISLYAGLVSVRLVAKYDLIAISPQGKALIYDWKTSQAKPKRQWLGKRLQTKVYPYLLARAGQHLNDQHPFQPEQIEMIYWFANHPAESVSFPYSSAAYQADEAYISGMIETIQRLDEDEFHLTSDKKRCAFCTFRSLCDRGVSAGSLHDPRFELDAEADETISLDFEQIPEIEF